MDLKKALEIIKQVCAVHVGNLQEHSAIQEALKIIEAELKSIEIEKKG